MKQQVGKLSDQRRRAVDRLLAEYLELPERDQRAFLDRCRQRWPRLSRWLVKLAGNGQTLTLFRDSAPALMGLDKPATDETMAQLPAGTLIGPWRILAEVGQGGMGKVYLGERADDAFEMKVAIKLIRQRRRGLADLLQRESRLLAKLEHAAITRLLDAGLDERAGPFLVMEWVEGLDLDAWLDTNPSIDQRLDVFHDIVTAVEHAHQRLVAHGDIKPGNIRMRTDGQVKLLDFGVARLLDDDRDQTGLRALTPDFAAPEQLDGDPVSPGSDIWSLGALLHWLLTRSILDPGKAAENELKQSGCARSRELSAIIEKACASHRENRYGSAGELLADLVRYMDHQPLRAMPRTTRYRVGKFLRRNPLLAGFSVLTLTLLISGLTAISLLYVDAESARQTTLVERDRAEDHAREAEQVASFQAELLGDLDLRAMATDLRLSLDEAGTGPPPGFDLTGTLLETVDTNLLEKSRRTIDQYFADRPLVQIRLLTSLAGTRRQLGLHQQASEIMDKLLGLAEAHLDPLHPLNLTVNYQRGLLSSVKGQHEQALSLFRQVLADRRSVLGSDHPDTISSKRELGILLQRMGQLDEAEDYYTRALARHRELNGDNHPSTLSSINDLGVLALERGEYQDAERFFRTAKAGHEATLGAEHPTTQFSMDNLAITLRRKGHFTEARNYYEMALKNRRRALGHQHPDTLQSMNNLAVQLLVMGETADAEPLFRESLHGFTRLYGLEHPGTLNTLNNLGMTLRSLDRLKEAESYLRQALAGRESVLGDDHPFTIVSRSSLGSVLLAANQPEEAHALLSKVLAFRLENLGRQHPQTILALSRLGLAESQLGNLEKAASLGQEAVELGREFLPEGHWHLASHMADYATTLRRSGEIERAESILLEASEMARAGLGDEHTLVNRIERQLEELR